MATKADTQIILYDLACIKNVCFSPVVWKIRLKLNYKRIPYETVFLEFPDIEAKVKEIGLPPNLKGTPYTVPVIYHIPTKKYLMDSIPISQFLEATYPDPPVTLTSELGAEIELKARGGLGPTHRASVMPREVRILSPRSQEYFRTAREAALGHTLEEELQGDKEEKAWASSDQARRELGQLLLSNKDKGPFILGDKASDTDFFLAGSLQSTRVIDEELWERCVSFPGFREIYDACVPFMNKKD